MRILFILFLSATSGACAGNLLVRKDQSYSFHNEKIATDAVGQLMKLYPPAKTQFNVIESALADFGALWWKSCAQKGRR
ncbi:hypothetical protein [Nitrosospira sp. Nsp1]|uniref:hypothetical protein n=1 Tax=Nitrosospira sp. Nsp1 TaxID=136547 RepID=UPI00088D0440|nr:Conjugal transfer protein TrbH [Nitrosospira sp. Nsp1]